MLLGEGWRAFFVCAVPAPATGQYPASAALRAVCAVRAGGVGDGSGPGVRRAARRRPKDSSNLQRCRVRPSEQLRAQALARRSSGHVSARVWSSIWSVLTSTRLQPPRLAKKLESPEARLVSPSISEAHYPPWGAPLSTLRTPLGRWAVWLCRCGPSCSAAPPRRWRSPTSPPTRRRRRTSSTRGSCAVRHTA